MSFILDALKKSESDRQRQSGPSLFEVKVTPPRRTLPVWAMAIAGLLGINVIVVSWMLLRHAPSQAQQPAAAGAPAVTRSAPPAAAPATAPATAGVAGDAAAAAGAADSRSAAARAAAPAAAPATAPVAGPAASPAAAPVGASPSPDATAAPARGTDQPGDQSPAAGNPSDYAPAVEPAAAPGTGAAAGAAGDLPLYQQIVGSDGLPALHLDLHVFARNPKDRFVMINMQRLGEGDSLPSGVHVDAIRPDGVVLSYHGTRFLLPRD